MPLDFDLFDPPPLKDPSLSPNAARALRGKRAYQNGLAAETLVEMHYQNHGYLAVARRWRGASGEVDLVMRKAGRLVFVVVKQSQSLDQARQALNAHQLQRICNASQEYLIAEGLPLETDMQIDLAAVDGVARVEIVENISAF